MKTIASGSTTTNIITGLTSNTTYVIQIRANHSNSSLSSPYSSTISTSTKLSTPTNLRTTSQTSTSISLAWDAVAGADGYTIQYCGGVGCTPDTDETIASGSTTTNTFTGLTQGTEYVFQIRATHTTASLNSSYSSTISQSTKLSTPTNLRTTSQTGTTLSLAWDTVAGADGYTIQYCDGVGCTPNTDETIASGSTTSSTITGLTQGTEYIFQIRATHTTASLNSPYSSTISVTIGLSTPANFRTTAQTPTSISLAWDEVAGASGYTIQYCDGVGCTPDDIFTISSGSTTARTITGLTQGTTYIFQIRAIHANSLFNSAYSNTISTSTKLSIPINLRTTAQTDTSISLAWDEATNADGYTIQYYCIGRGCTPAIDTTISGGSTTVHTFTGFTSNTTYIFQIKATHTTASLNSSYSSTISQSTKLSTPTNLRTTSQASTTISLAWDVVAGADGYTIQYCDGVGCTPNTDETIASGSTTTNIITGLTSNTTYVIQIRANHSNSSLSSPYSSTISTSTKLSTPTNLRTTAQTSTSISLAWDAVAGADGYTIQYCDGVGCTPDDIFTIASGSTTTNTFTGLTQGTEYVFQIRATHTTASLNSSYSSTISSETILAPPSNFRATSQTAETLTLAWDAVAGADGYTIQYCDGVGCTPDTDETIASGSTTTNTFTGLTQGTEYIFQIRATHTNSSLNSSYSSTISSETTLAPPSNFRATSQTAETLTLAWDEVAGADGYTIQYCDGVGCTPDDIFTISSGSTTTNTFTGLTQGTEYVFQIKATHTTASLNSPYSSTISQSTKLSTPTNLRATSQTSTSISLIWDAVIGAIGYEVQYCDGTACTPDENSTISSGSTTSSTITGLTQGTEYVLQIRATHTTASSNSLYSSTISSETTLAPPSNFRATSQTAETLTLAWDAVAGADGYTIQYCDGVGCTPNTDETIASGSTTSSTITGLTQGTEYVFQIRATHTTASLNSPYSSTISQSTKLSTPTNLRTTAQTSTSISLAWDAVAGADGYTIQYCGGVGCTPDTDETIASGSTTTNTFTGLTQGTEYVFQIKATHTTASLNSPYSSTISQSTKLSTPTNLRIASNADTSISLEWDVVTGATGYEVQYCDNAACTPDETKTISGGLTTTSTITGLATITVYVLQVKATHSNPLLDSTYSSTVSINTILSTPSNFRLINSASSTQIFLGWNVVADAIGYRIKYCDGADCTPIEAITISVGDGFATSYSFSNFTPNTVYRFQIKAKYSDALFHSKYTDILSDSTTP